jgi:hypothetical protein
MRFYEISSGVRIPVSEEEQAILDMITNDHISKAALDERQQEVARLMVTRGLLVRERDEDDAIVLRPNSAVNIWRF